MAERHCAVCRWARDRVERCTGPAAGRARPARSSRGAAVSGLDAIEVLFSCGLWADTERGGNLNPREAAVPCLGHGVVHHLLTIVSHLHGRPDVGGRTAVTNGRGVWVDPFLESCEIGRASCRARVMVRAG